MGSRKNNRRYKDIKNKNHLNEKIEWYRSIKKIVGQGNYTKALTEINEYIEQNPEDCFGKLLKGIILSNLRQLDEAKEIFKELIDTNAKNKNTAMYQLGCIYKIEGRREKSKMYFQKTIDESPYEEGFSRIELSEFFLEECNYEKARKILENIDSDRLRNYVLLQLSKIELSAGNSIESFNQISKINTIETESLRRKVALQRGRIEASFNNYDYATKYFEEAMRGRKNSIYWSALIEQGKLENHFLNYRKALEICKTLLDNNQPLDGETNILLGKTYENMLDFNNAEKYYKRARDNKEVNKRDKANFHIGMLKLKEKDTKQAVEYFEKVENNLFYKKAALLNTIYIKIRENNYKEAEDKLNELLSKHMLTKNTKEYNIIRILINKGLNQKDRCEYTDYLENQYIAFDIKETIKHVKENHQTPDMKNKSIFSPDIDIECLITEVLSELSEDKLVKMDLGDVYVINYPNIGYAINGESADKIKVITIPNTTNIVNMYPIDDDQTKEKEKPKTKRLSQIEKFNKKYNLK